MKGIVTTCNVGSIVEKNISWTKSPCRDQGIDKSISITHIYNEKDQEPSIQESYNTPLEHTPGNPLPNYERIPFTACWKRFRGVFQRCVETTLEDQKPNSDMNKTGNQEKN